MRTLRGLLVLAALLPATDLIAQEKDTPWAAFVGCWQPIDEERMISSTLTCIVPVAENDFGAQVITVSGATVVRSVTLLANGTRVAMDDAQCTGWEVASFSDDGARLYLSGETKCGDAPAVRTSSLYALLLSGTRLVVSGARTEANEQVQAQRSRLVPVQNLTGPMVAGLEALLAATGGARRAASRALRVSDVIEASARVHPSVAEAWLAEVAMETPAGGLELKTSDLRALAAAQVPIDVIDMLVAVAHPTHFRVAIARVENGYGPSASGRTGEPGWDQAGWARRTSARGLSASDCSELFSRAAFGSIMGQATLIGQNGRLRECYGSSAFGRFGPFGGIGFGGFGYAGFMYAGFYMGWNDWNGWNGWGQTNRYRGYYSEDRSRPIQVTVDRVNPDGARPTNGRVVRGEGYTQGGGSTTGRAAPRGSTSMTPGSTDSGAPRYSDPGGSAPQSPASPPSAPAPTTSLGEPTGRTAKPRVP